MGIEKVFLASLLFAKVKGEGRGCLFAEGPYLFAILAAAFTLVLFRDSLLPRPKNGPGTQAGKERVLYYLQAHARNEPIRLQKIEQRRLLSDWLLKIVGLQP